jgi:DNA invertase Pin-like site-specific DNA recombinase
MPRPRASMAVTGPNGGPAFVAYYRVSTLRQGVSGLGLDAQRSAVAGHVASAGGRLVAEYQEIESGKWNDRPQLAAALAACRARHAVLIVAKLDRLARNAAFLLTLVEGLGQAGVLFCDMPQIQSAGVYAKIILGQMALIAEAEAAMISQRTKDALRAVKARGVVLGNPHIVAGDRSAQRAGRRTQRARSQQRHSDLLPHVRDAQAAGAKSLRAIAAKLTSWSIPPPSGGATWHASQVRRVLKTTLPGSTCDVRREN